MKNNQTNNPIPTLEELKDIATLKPGVNDEDARPYIKILDPDTACDIHTSTKPLHHDEHNKEEPTLRQSNQTHQPTEKAAHEGDQLATRLEKTMVEVRESKRR